jgi:hypothetical protein
MIEPERPQMIKQNGVEKWRVACRVAKARIQTHTLRI